MTLRAPSHNVSRRRGREFAMQLLYAAEVGGDTLEKAAGTLSKEDPPLSEDQQEYGLKLARSVREHADEIDAFISDTSANWDLTRLAVVDRIILRMAIAELRYVPEVPSKVCLNEAVEIAKKFSTEDSSRYVNGILDTVARKILNDTSTPLSHKDPNDP